MTKHVHRLVFTDERNVICDDLGCDFRLSWGEAERRLTKYDKLEAETRAFVICKQQMDMYASMTIGGLSEDFGWLRDRVNDALLTREDE